MITPLQNVTFSKLNFLKGLHYTNVYIDVAIKINIIMLKCVYSSHRTVCDTSC